MRAAATLKAYLDLSRVSNLPTVWTNVLAASVLAGGASGPAAVVPPVLSISSFYVAGMALNDLCDREHDLVHRPSRPIPSGRVGVAQVRVFVISLFALAFLLLGFAPHSEAALPAMLLLAAIVLYDLNHKENPYSVLLMASCRFLAFLVAAVAASGALNAKVVLAASVQFGYIVLLSLVARHENSRPQPFPVAVVPLMLAGISLLDGLLLAFLADPLWFFAGVAGFLLTLGGQRRVRGD